MPTYIYKHPQKEEYVEVVQSMNDVHEFSKNGVRWIRQFSVPQMSMKTQVDPFSSKDFIEKTGSMKGTYGDLLDYSKELSEKRASKVGGEDPVLRKKFNEYAKRRKGKLHPKDPKRYEPLEKLGVSISN